VRKARRRAGVAVRALPQAALATRAVAAALGVAALAGALPREAFGHPGQPVAPHDLAGSWFEDPWALGAIGAAAWLYARGTGRVWGRAGKGRAIPRWRFRCYAGGIAVLFLALVSPLDAWGGALFSAHMVQHELLILGAAPLLVLGAPLIAFLWAIPRGWRRRLGRWAATPVLRGLWTALTHPVTAWTLHAAALWVWHAPPLYQATLTRADVHALQHLSFFLTALLFWWPLLHPSRHRRLGHGLAVLYLFTTALHGSALGAFLSLSGRPWYPIYAESAALWDLTPLEDQQLGGLIMWIPFGLLYTLAAIVLLGDWLRRQESRVISPA
jgi:putative membrane protein